MRPGICHSASTSFASGAANKGTDSIGSRCAESTAIARASTSSGGFSRMTMPEKAMIGSDSLMRAPRTERRKTTTSRCNSMTRTRPSAVASTVRKRTGRERGSSRSRRLDPAGVVPPALIQRLVIPVADTLAVPADHGEHCSTVIRATLKRLVNRRFSMVDHGS